MPEVPDGAQVQEAGAPVVAHGRGQGRRGVENGSGVGAIGVRNLETGTIRSSIDPARRGGDADAETVVLAHEENRYPPAGMGRHERPVERALHGRVVERRVAEAGHDDAVGRPRQDLRVGCVLDAQGEAHRSREVRSDGRRLRHDVQPLVAEHLVAASGDGLGAAGEHPAEHVGDGIVIADLRGPGEVEPTGPVVQQRRIGRAERPGDGGVALVAGGPDRVVPEAVLGAEPAGGVVGQAGSHLGLEQFGRHQRIDGGPRRGLDEGLETGQTSEQRALEVVEVVGEQGRVDHDRAFPRNIRPHYGTQP